MYFMQPINRVNTMIEKDRNSNDIQLTPSAIFDSKLKKVTGAHNAREDRLNSPNVIG